MVLGTQLEVLTGAHLQLQCGGDQRCGSRLLSQPVGGERDGGDVQLWVAVGC